MHVYSNYKGLKYRAAVQKAQKGRCSSDNWIFIVTIVFHFYLFHNIIDSSVLSSVQNCTSHKL